MWGHLLGTTRLATLRPIVHAGLGVTEGPTLVLQVLLHSAPESLVVVVQLRPDPLDSVHRQMQHSCNVDIVHVAAPTGAVRIEPSPQPLGAPAGILGEVSQAASAEEKRSGARRAWRLTRLMGRWGARGGPNGLGPRPIYGIKVGFLELSPSQMIVG